MANIIVVSDCTTGPTSVGYLRPPTPPPPPPPPTLGVTSSITVGSTISGPVTWTATITVGTAARVDFLVDGVITWTEAIAPYQYNGDPSGVLDTTSLGNGTHSFTVVATDSVDNTLTATAGGNVTVNNTTGPPFTTFTATDAAAHAGDTINVPAGTYTERFTLNKSGVHWILDPAAVLNYTGVGVAVQAGGFNINGNDIIFEGGRGTGSAGAEYIVNGDRVTILNHQSDHHIEEAYVWHGQDGRITGGSIHHCNETGQVWDSSEQGAGKTTRPGLIIDSCHLYSIGLGAANSSAGQGFWWDSIKGTNNLPPGGPSQGWAAEVRYCLIEDVLYAGIMFEISVTGKFHHNVVLRCGTTTSGSGFWGSGILSSTSSDVDVHANVFHACQSSFRCVCQSDRTDSPRTAGGVIRIPDTVKFHDNVSLDPTFRQFAFTADGASSAAWNTAITSVANGNQVYNNQFHGTLSHQWGTTVDSTLAHINTLPGGGGNTVISDALRDSIVASFASGDVPTILAAAGIP